MDGEVGYIYIREHEAYNNYAACKLGKTQCIPERENTYITGEIVKGTFTLVFEVNNQQLDWIEKVLQENFKIYNIYINGGTEFFKLEIKELIEPYFKEKNIQYKILTQEEISNLKRKYRETKQKESGIQEPENIVKEDNTEYDKYLQQVKTTSLKLLTLKNFPKKFLTFELCIEAIKKLEEYDNMSFSRLLKFIPDNIKIYNFWFECVKINGMCLQKVPEEHKTCELCIESIKHLKLNCYGVFGNYKFIPDNIKNYNFWLEFVRIDGMCLREVPEKHKTCELCIESIKKLKYDGIYDVDWLLNFIPNNIKNYNFWLECVKIKGMYLYKVPENLIDYNLIFTAFKTDSVELDYKIENFKSIELCVDAIKNNMGYLHFLSNKILNYNFCLGVIKDGCGLEDIPKKFITEELCLEAVKKYGFDIEFVPKEIKTNEFYLEAVKIEVGSIEYIPDNYKTYDIYLQAIKNGLLIKNIPDNYKTHELYLEAVKKNGMVLEFVPKY